MTLESEPFQTDPGEKEDARLAEFQADYAAQLEEMASEIDRRNALLLDVEGVFLAYWTDIRQAEIQRLLPLIRATLGDYEPRAAADTGR